VNRRTVHAERECLLEQRQGLGEVLGIEGGASLGEARLRFHRCGVRSRASQQRDADKKSQRRAAGCFSPVRAAVG
jgi:hypothetical protein